MVIGSEFIEVPYLHPPIVHCIDSDLAAHKIFDDVRNIVRVVPLVLAELFRIVVVVKPLTRVLIPWINGGA